MNLHEILLASKIAGENGGSVDLSNYYTKTQTDNLITTVLDMAAINSSTLGYSAKNLLINNSKTKTLNGVTATINADKSITLTGKNTAGKDFVIFTNLATGLDDQFAENKKFLSNGDYILSGGSTSAVLQVTVSETNNSAVNVASSSGNAAKFVIEESEKYVWFRLLIRTNADFSTPVTVFPMVRCAAIADDAYEPYRPSVAEYIAGLEKRITALEAMNTEETEEINVTKENEE